MKPPIRYNIPTYKLGGRATLYFAGWKAHFSIYPASAQLVAAIKGARAAHTINKSTIRFPLDQPVAVTLIARIANERDGEA